MQKAQTKYYLVFVHSQPFRAPYRPWGGSQISCTHIYKPAQTSFCLANNKTHFSFPVEHGLYHILLSKRDL